MYNTLCHIIYEKISVNVGGIGAVNIKREKKTLVCSDGNNCVVFQNVFCLCEGREMKMKKYWKNPYIGKLSVIYACICIYVYGVLRMSEIKFLVPEPSRCIFLLFTKWENERRKKFKRNIQKYFLFFFLPSFSYKIGLVSLLKG